MRRERVEAVGAEGTEGAAGAVSGVGTVGAAGAMGAGGGGACLGVLVLDAGFARIPGDVGCPGTFEGVGEPAGPETFGRAGALGRRVSVDAPALFRTVPGATVARVIGRQDGGLVELFAEHAAALAAAGATAITTSCGFMARHQRELAARVAVPFAASALCLLGALQREYGVVGVITADSARLTREHFTACGAVPPSPVPPEALRGTAAGAAGSAAERCGAMAEAGEEGVPPRRGVRPAAGGEGAPGLVAAGETTQHGSAAGAGGGDASARPGAELAAGAVVAGMQGKPAFRGAILTQTRPLSPEAVCAEVVDVGRALVEEHPEVRAILLECTNLPPYAETLARAVGLPVFDVLTLCRELAGVPQGDAFRLGR